MTCSHCGADNPASKKFCGDCGGALENRCPHCRADNPTNKKFCGDCGTSLVAQPGRAADKAEARKVVTIVFADLIGSTSLHERLDAESTRRLMDRYYRLLRGAVETHGGTIVKLMGDGVMAAFGVPHVTEDDAIRAVRAGVAMQEAMKGLGGWGFGATGQTPTPTPVTPSPLGLRVGINTGEVVVSADNTDVVGDPVNVAARLQQEAHDGDVLIGESTRRLVSERVILAPAGVFALKGRAETVAAHRVVSLERPAGAAATAFVGRDEELRRLLTVYDAAVAERRARLAVVLGSPGLGKSRLLDEVGRRLGKGATVLTAHCEAAGGATFVPIARAMRTFLNLGVGASDDAVRAAIEAAIRTADTERTRIAEGIAALLAGTPGSPEETFFVIRRFLAAVAITQPVLLAVDDLQWAEPLLLDLVEHLVQWGSGTPLLVLAAARPELRDSRSSLTTNGVLVSDVVTLAGLDASAATRLAANVIGADALPAAVAGRVLATSEGNPLFVGELVRMLVDDGALKKDGARWTTAVDLSTLSMPPTIHALLAARIERLRPEDRLVLERAAVVGRQFSRSAVAHLLTRDVRDLDARLEALRRSELIEPDTTWFLGEPALRFHHGLTRDAAYRRLLKETRAELHGQCAEWIEGKVGDTIEHDELLGWHLEQAHRHLYELGPLDAQGKALGERAARHLGAAGRRALARDDATVAADLLGRALHVLDAADPASADLALDWCEALLAAGDVGHAKAAIDELAALIRRLGVEAQNAGYENSNSLTPNPLPAYGRLSAWHACFAGQLAVLTDPQTLHTTVDALAAAAMTLAGLSDFAGEAKAHQVHAQALQRLGSIGACEAALDKALAAARRVDDRRRSNAVLAGAPQAALWGPSPVTRASGRCLDVVRVLRITQGAPAVEAVALRCQAVLEALRGRTEAARRMITSSRQMVEELGITQQVLETDTYFGLIELLEEDAAAAERSLRPAYEGFRTHGLGIDAARAAALLGRALFIQGNIAEAEALSHESEALAGDDLQAAIAWRRVRAETLAARGEHTASVEVARTAVQIASATDSLLLHANARMALAAALRAAGRRTDAAMEEARAIELWEAKGATLLTERARSSRTEEDAPLMSPHSPGPFGYGQGDRKQSEVGSPHLSPRPEGEVEPLVRSPMWPNAAIAYAARVNAAFVARDMDALAALIDDHAVMVDHPHGAELGRDQMLDLWHSFLDMEDLRVSLKPMATLGDSLALLRTSASSSGVARGDIDAGPYEREEIVLVEVSAGQGRRTEFFAIDHLGDAIARLYERYAELFPEGAKRIRAAATARSVATLLGPPDADRFAAVIAPDVQLFDHRVVGPGPGCGAETFLQGFRALLGMADNWTTCVDDVLALRSDALLLRRVSAGTDRATGGAFERHLIVLWTFGSDGLVIHSEQFDPDRESEALARFDELTSSSTSSVGKGRLEKGAPLPRYVRSNAATAFGARFDAAIGARNAAALANLIAEDTQVVDHTTGATYSRDGVLFPFRSIGAQALTHRLDPLATLGPSLALFRMFASRAALVTGDFDVGVLEVEKIVLIGVDADERLHLAEFFALDHVGDAIVRLYELYATTLADGPPRTRAVAIARSVVALLGPPDHWPFAADAEATDHRTVGFGCVRGGEAVLQAIRALLQLSEDFTARIDDVLALRHDAFLVRWTTSGTLRSSGGLFDRNSLMLWLLGADGLLECWEQFETDHESQALARFDDLARRTSVLFAKGEARAERSLPGRGSPCQTFRRPHGTATIIRRVRPNAAAASEARLIATMAARDGDALSDLFADDLHVVHHPTGLMFHKEGNVSSLLAFLASDTPRFEIETLATLGDSLSLSRNSLSASSTTIGTLELGAFETELVVLNEVDAEQRCRHLEFFSAEHLGEAVARLYERYAELLPEGPARDRAAATARSVAGVGGQYDFDAFGRAFAPNVESVDHRILGTWSAQGAEAVLRNLRTLRDLTDDFVVRDDDILALRPDAYLLRRTVSGTDRAGGGAFERIYLGLCVFGADGLITRWEQFDADREREALARFDELRGEAGARSRAAQFENAATRSWDRYEDAWKARDWDRIAAVFAADFREIDRRPMMHVEVDREAYLEVARAAFDMAKSVLVHTVLATRGEQLALAHLRYEISDDGGHLPIGTAVVEWLGICEVNERGERIATVRFDPDDLDAAYAELDERYAAGEAAPHGRVAARMGAFARAIAAWDWDALSALVSPEFQLNDHGPLGREILHGPAAYLGSLKSLVDLAPDVRLRRDHMRVSDRAALVVSTWVGSREGGAFEAPRAVVFDFDAGGQIHSLILYNLDQLDAAWACYEEIAGRSTLGEAPQRPCPEEGRSGGISSAAADANPPQSPFSKEGSADPLAALIKPNAVTAAMDRFGVLLEARDWDGIRALCTADAKLDDRRRLLAREPGPLISNLQAVVEVAPDVRYERRPIATAGDRVALERHLSVSGPSEAPAEIEYLCMIEVDEAGRIADIVLFDLDDRRAASRETLGRWLSTDAVAAAVIRPVLEINDGFNDHDRERIRAVLADEIIVVDHRLTGLGEIHGPEAYIESLAVTWPNATDIQSDWFPLLHDRHGSLGVASIFGRFHGGYFEVALVSVQIVTKGRIDRIETFETKDLDTALARFEALRPDPLRIPPNAATRARDRHSEALAARDLEALTRLCAPTMIFDDRRRGVLLTGDRDMFIASNRITAGARLTHTLLATAGDRLALEHLRWSGGAVGQDWEAENLSLHEVDAEGRTIAVIAFDAGDRRAASLEMQERYARSDAARCIPAAAAEAFRAWNAQDLSRLRAAVADDFVLDDRRRTGVGRIEGADAYIASAAAVFEQISEETTEPLYVVAVETHGALAMQHAFGRFRHGGEYEIVYVALAHYRAGRYVGLELFEPENLDAALARFEALRPVVERAS